MIKSCSAEQEKIFLDIIYLTKYNMKKGNVNHQFRQEVISWDFMIRA